MLNARNEALTIGATAVQVSQNQEAFGAPRVAYALRNSSTSGQIIAIYLSDAQVASSTTAGIVLSPGQSFTDADSEGYICWKGNISAIADGAGAVLSIFERR